MIVNDSNGLSAADIAAVTGGANNGAWGNGFGGDGAWWLLVLFLFAFNGNWGNGGNGCANGGSDMNYFYNTQTQADVNRGFADLTTQNAVSALQASVNDGFSNQAVSQCNQTTTLLQGQNQIQNSILTGIASIGNQACQDKFDTITTIVNGQNNLATQMAANEAARVKCCCDEQLLTTQQTTTLLQDNALTRQVIQQGIQDLKDMSSQQELAAERRENENLRSQLTTANQNQALTALGSRILADNAAQTVALEQYLNPTPVPAYVVQNPNCCPNAGGNYYGG